jgi:Protein of unknown function (DUF2794)
MKFMDFPVSFIVRQAIEIYKIKMILFFRNNRNARPVFSKGELSLILGVYGERVKRGEWRDYAIDSLPDMAVFSVFRSTLEAPLYAISKIPARNVLKPAQYTVSSGNKTIKEGNSLGEVLQIFEDDKT